MEEPTIDLKPEHKKPETHVPVDEPKQKSKGEKFFDRFVYGGIAGVGTFVVTVPMAYLLRYHTKIAPYFDKAANGVHRAFSTLPFAWAKRRSFAEQFMMVGALMQGGNLMLLPIGWLEKRKVAIVSGLNTTFGDTTPAERIEEAPKQTWGSLIESRLVAFATVLGAYVGVSKLYPKALPMFEHETGERLCQLMGKPLERTVNGVTRPTKTYVFGKLSAVDLFATAAAATLLYIGGHFFARKQEERKENREARRHHGHEPGREEAEAGALLSAAATQVVGEKQHAGTLSAARERAQGG